jgi:glutathione S-transferase
VIIHHISLQSDWDAAIAVGEYRVSTRVRRLEDEGFIHASYPSQVAGVAMAFYRGVSEPLLLLSIETSLLDSDVIAENTGGGIELFPHIYGPVPVSAVVAADPLVLDADGRIRSGPEVVTRTGT